MKEGRMLFEQILSAHHSGDEGRLEKLMEEIYTGYRPEFLSWLQREFQISAYYASEIYQKTMVIFYSNIKNGKLHTLTSKLKTYIFGIGKHVLFELRREDKGSTPYDEIPLEVQGLDLGYLEREKQQHQDSLVQLFLSKLSEKCRKILELYYFHNFSMEAIANNLNYQSEDVAKKSKYECLKRLRKLANDSSVRL